MDLILIILIIFIPLIAEIRITLTYNKYKRSPNEKGLTGYDVARKILDENDLSDIYIVEVRGELSDHYDPTQKVVRLSSDVYHNSSVASIAIAAHECGHAIQDKEGYSFLRIRSAIYPIVNIATSISYYIILIGFLLQFLDLVYMGIAFTSLGLLFQIITLPVEFDASKRALTNIEKEKMVTNGEWNGAKNVLTAAALTYVAGVLASAFQIIRLVLIFGDDRDRRR